MKKTILLILSFLLLVSCMTKKDLTIIEIDEKNIQKVFEISKNFMKKKEVTITNIKQNKTITATWLPKTENFWGNEKLQAVIEITLKFKLKNNKTRIYFLQKEKQQKSRLQRTLNKLENTHKLRQDYFETLTKKSKKPYQYIQKSLFKNKN